MNQHPPPIYSSWSWQHEPWWYMEMAGKLRWRNEKPTNEQRKTEELSQQKERNFPQGKGLFLNVCVYVWCVCVCVWCVCVPVCICVSVCVYADVCVVCVCVCVPMCMCVVCVCVVCVYVCLCVYMQMCVCEYVCVCVKHYRVALLVEGQAQMFENPASLWKHQGKTDRKTSKKGQWQGHTIFA